MNNCANHGVWVVILGWLKPRERRKCLVCHRIVSRKEYGSNQRNE